MSLTLITSHLAVWTATNVISVLEDAPAQLINLTGISAGPNETQTLTVTATSANAALIPNGRADSNAPFLQLMLHGPAWRWWQALRYRTAPTCPAEMVDPLARQAREHLRENYLRSLDGAEPQNYPASPIGMALEIERDWDQVCPLRLMALAASIGPRSLNSSARQRPL